MRILCWATDPDADRLGVYVKDTATGEYVSFTGNMSGMVIAHYILSQRKENHTLPDNGALVKTIVTTNMADALAKDFDVKLIEVLTGFKYIGEQIKFLSSSIIMSMCLASRRVMVVLLGPMRGTRMLLLR